MSNVDILAKIAQFKGDWDTLKTMLYSKSNHIDMKLTKYNFNNMKTNLTYIANLYKKYAKKATRVKNSNFNVYEITPELSSFLKLKERGLNPKFYVATLALSYIYNYITVFNLNGVVEVEHDNKVKRVYIVKLNEELRTLFKSHLQKVGTGLKDKHGNPTAVLDENGKQINELPLIKLITLISYNIVKHNVTIDNEVKVKRKSIDKNIYSDVYQALKVEQILLTQTIKDVKLKYTNTSKIYNKYESTKDMYVSAKDIGIKDVIEKAKRDLMDAKYNYRSTLIQNNLPIGLL